MRVAILAGGAWPSASDFPAWRSAGDLPTMLLCRLLRYSVFRSASRNGNCRGVKIMKYVGEKVMNKAAHAGNQHLLLPIPALFHKPYVISRVATDMYPSFIFQQTQKPKSLDRDKGPGQNYYRHNITGSRILFCIFFGVLGCVGHSSAYVAHL